MKIVAEDPNDGRLILDYLGTDVILKNDPLGREVYSSARKYIERVLQERSLIENDKVFNKFGRLRNYFDSRPPRT
jgi:aminoglycoside/choline kinase family phosphotransferase